MTPLKKKTPNIGLQHMLKNEGSPLSMNDGRDYSVAGRSAADMAGTSIDAKGTIHNQYSTLNTPLPDNITPRWIGQFGATINAIPQPTSVGLSGAGIVDRVKYLNFMPV